MQQVFTTWDHENHFYWNSDVTRLSKLLSHYEVYKSILDIPGDIFEFGVYKGTSFIRWLTFRHILENDSKRKCVGFDAFGEFPLENVASTSDIDFIQSFQNAGGDGLTVDALKAICSRKNFINYQLIKGNVLETFLSYLSQNSCCKISLLHLDMDVYEPTAHVLKHVKPYLSRGAKIVVDDYGTVDGATRAIDEFVNDNPHEYTIPRNDGFYKVPIVLQKL